MDTALIIIDVQRLLCEGRWACEDADAVIARLNQAIATARAAGAPVVFVQHEGQDPEDPMRHGQPGWALAPTLDVRAGDPVVAKTTCDSFHQTGLQALLERLQVRRLAIGGMQTDFCVDTTIRRALALGYPVALLDDAHTTVDNGVLTAAQIRAHHGRTLSQIDSFGVRVQPVAAADWRP